MSALACESPKTETHYLRRFWFCWWTCQPRGAKFGGLYFSRHACNAPENIGGGHNGLAPHTQQFPQGLTISSLSDKVAAKTLAPIGHERCEFLNIEVFSIVIQFVVTF